ncbi:hypothetical protein PROFUN_07254 [Planoprotostelium fungivorum]|uniref:CUE domain-containing protein n=1 Tax=Planoprotostelium fungivorum TaxID=1890364 RepID=A0A2P6NM84_9EUKA|nr:hypothetical protein PROFUN_07254 [Planoprotostelium fungivorum]
MGDYAAQQLHLQFPDLSQSTVADILSANGNDSFKTVGVLKDMNDTVKTEQEVKIREMSDLFPNIKIKIIREVLTENNWDVEAAILPLFNRGEEQKAQEKKRQEEQQRQLRKAEQEAKKRREVQDLMTRFSHIPKDIVQQVMDDNEGDIEATTDALTQLVERQQLEDRKREQKKEEERASENLRNLKIRALGDKFDVTDQEAVEALTATDWNIRNAFDNLFVKQCEKKKSDLKKIFPIASDQAIEEALSGQAWDVVKAAEKLNLDRKNSEEEKRKKMETQTWNNQYKSNILQTSMLIGRKVEEEIEELQNEMKKDTLEMFKANLEDVIAAQARHGVTPGYAPPPTVNEIKEIMKAAPVVDAQLLESVQEKEFPSAPANSDKPAEGASALSVRLTVTPANPDVGNVITVEWNITSENFSTNHDWIGLYQLNQPNKKYETYQWVGRDKKSGSLTYYAPKIYGQYEFRYFFNNSYVHVEKSIPVTVGPQMEVKAVLDETVGKIRVEWTKISGNEYSSAWVGLYDKSQGDNRKYITWEYAKNGGLTFDAPIKPSLYEVRYFTNSYHDISRSNAIHIQGEDRINVRVKEGRVHVDLNIVSVDPAYSNAWIGLYLSQQGDNRQWRRYKYIKDRSAGVSFGCPKTAGEYEARVFANKTYDLLLKSSTFNLPQ